MLTPDELEHLRHIQVCGCDGSCAPLTCCPTPVLDGIGCDWIADHFDGIVETLSGLAEIARIIESVDNRCMAGDGPVTPTLQEMRQDEISRIYALASGKGLP